MKTKSELIARIQALDPGAKRWKLQRQNVQELRRLLDRLESQSQVPPPTRRPPAVVPKKRVTARNQKLILDGFLKTFPDIDLAEVWLIVFEDGVFIGARGDRYRVYSTYREYVFIPD
jgi:hypothetical protein